MPAVLVRHDGRRRGDGGRTVEGVPLPGVREDGCRDAGFAPFASATWVLRWNVESALRFLQRLADQAQRPPLSQDDAERAMDFAERAIGTNAGCLSSAIDLSQTFSAPSDRWLKLLVPQLDGDGVSRRGRRCATSDYPTTS